MKNEHSTITIYVAKGLKLQVKDNQLLGVSGLDGVKFNKFVKSEGAILKQLVNKQYEAIFYNDSIILYLTIKTESVKKSLSFILSMPKLFESAHVQAKTDDPNLG